MESLQETTAARGNKKKPQPFQDDGSRDLKSYLAGLERDKLVVLAGKYKIKICKTGRKQQMIDTFVNRVPSDMVELICGELEKRELARYNNR